MRRFHILSAALLLVLGACSGGATTPTSASSTTSLVVSTTSTVPPTTSIIPAPIPATSITVWAPGDAVSVVRAAATAFEAASGVAVEVIAIESDAALDQILADPASGPEVFFGPHSWLTTLAEAGVAEPLTLRGNTVAAALAAVTLRGAILAAPVGLDTIVQFRNTSELAVAPSAAESFAIGCLLDSDFVPCLLLPIDSVDGHYPFIASGGGYVFGPDPFDGWDAGDVGVDNEGALAGLGVLETIIGGADLRGDGDSSAEQRFSEGVAPLLWGNVESLRALQVAGAPFVVETLPTIGGQPARTPVRVTAAWVNAFAPGKEAATLFVEEYLSEPTVIADLAAALGAAPVDPGFDADPELMPFVQQASSGDPVPTIYQTAYAWEQLAVAFSQIRSGDDLAGAMLDAAVKIRNAPKPEPAADA